MTRKPSVILLAIVLSLTLFASTAFAAAAPYVYFGQDGKTLDWIIANPEEFDSLVNETDPDEILVDASTDGSGAYLNFGAFVDDVLAGNASVDDPAGYQQENPATPPGDEEELEVISVSAINAINVDNGTAVENIGLPAEVEITLSDDTKVNVPVSFACETYDATTAGTYTFVGTLDLSGLENVAATELTASVDVVVAEAVLAVESVSAINKTTVEVTFAELEEGQSFDDVTFQFEGEAVAATWADEVATLTVPAMLYNVDYTLSVLDDEVQIASETFTFTGATVTAISTETPANVTEQVGNNVSITYAVVDEGDDAMKGLQVRVRAIDAVTSDVVEEEVLTTDANGQVTFTYTSVDDDTHNISAVVLDRPVIRDNTVTVEWNLAPAGLVSVNKKTAANLGDFTWQEYTVTAKNEDGTNFVGRINMDLAFTDGAVGNLTVEALDPVAETWTKTITASANPNQFGVALAAADAGQVTIRLANDGTDVNVVPTFWYASPVPAIMTALGTTETIDDNDPRDIAERVTWEDQVPTISIAAADDATISSADEAIYTVTVVDQYSNPYRGADITVDFWQNHDNLAGTTSGTATVDIDYNQDGTATEGAGNDVAADLTVATGNVGAENGVFNVHVAGADGDGGTLLVWQDENTDSVLDADESRVIGATVSFEDPVVTTIEAEAVTEGNVAVNGSAIYAFTFFDQFGEEITPVSGDNLLAISGRVTGDDVGTVSIVGIDNNYDGETYGQTHAVGGTSFNDMVSAGATIAIEIDSGTLGDQAILQVWSDVTNNDTFDLDDPNTEIVTAEWVAGILDAGEIGAITTPGSSTGVFETNFDSAYIDYTAVDGNAVVRYDLLDQAGNGLTTTAATNVNWTITNTGETAVTVNDGTAKTLAAGATATYTTVAAAGANANATISIISGAENRVNVSVVAEGVDEATETALFWTETIVGADETYTGTVVAFDTAVEWFILETSIGYVVVDDYAAAGTFTAVTRTVNGNTASHTQFENNLSIGDAITITTDGTPDATIALTNN